MKSLAISAAAAALTLLGCAGDTSNIDPTTQWQLTLHVIHEGQALGHIDVRDDDVELVDCEDNCVYAIDATDLVRLHAMEDDTDGSLFIEWSGDCDGTDPDYELAAAEPGIELDCTAKFSTLQNATEVCDNQLDDDASGELDCSDTSCTGDPACEPTQFGDFADDDGLDYAQVGTTTCGLPDPMEDWSLTPGGILFPTFGDNTDVFFDIVDGSTYQASATGLDILGAPDHTCTLYESEYGTPVHVVWSFNCTNPGGGSCSQGFNAARP